jgi:hypothetical protein
MKLLVRILRIENKHGNTNQKNFQFEHSNFLSIIVFLFHSPLKEFEFGIFTAYNFYTTKNKNLKWTLIHFWTKRWKQ